MDKKKIDFTPLYALCNQMKLFTCGSVSQYENMFELAATGITRTELAYILYICSDYRLDFIYKAIEPLFDQGD